MMKSGKRWPLLLLLIAVGVLGTRLAWRLSVSETGWTPHLRQWAYAATSLVGVELRELGDQTPAEQAKFWLKQVEQLEPDSDDPQIAMGAAWMLDAPQWGFLRRHVRNKAGLDFPGMPARGRGELDEETIVTMSAEFERLCRQEARAQIEKAVPLDATSVELRRARALLLFQTKLMNHDLEPRQDDWLSVLDECAQADLENALYDYLAALHLWTSSADYAWQEDGYVLRVADKERFEQGRVRLAAGIKKPHLKFGSENYAATLKFLQASSVSRGDSLKAAESRQIDSRATSLLYHIVRWENVQSDEAKRAGRLEEAVRVVRDVLAISEQVTAAGNSPSVLTPKLSLRRWSMANLKDFHEDHPNLLSADEAATVSKQSAEVQRELRILEEVGRRMAARAATSASEGSLGRTANVQLKLWSVFLMLTATTLVIVCAGLALLSFLVSVLCGGSNDSDPVTLGWVRHTVAWLLGGGISFVLLGLFPAEIVSAQVQTWLVCGAVWVGFGSVLLGSLHLFQRPFQLPVGQVAALALVTALPLIAVPYSVQIIDLAVAEVARLHPMLSIGLMLFLALGCGAELYFLWKFTTNPHLTHRHKLLAVCVALLIALVAVPTGTAVGALTYDLESRAWIAQTVPKEAEGLQIEPDEFQGAMKLDGSKWAWGCIQWQAHHGPLVGPSIAVAIVMFWHLIRRAHQTEGGLGQVLRSQKRVELRESGKSVAGSCLVTSLLCLALYLGTTPLVADAMDSSYRVRHLRMMRPEQIWNEVTELIVEIKADKETITRLLAEIDERNHRPAEQSTKH